MDDYQIIENQQAFRKALESGQQEAIEHAVVYYPESIRKGYKDDSIAALKARIEELEARLHEVREIYTGSEGFKPETAPEAYQKRLLDQMYKAAVGE